MFAVSDTLCFIFSVWSASLAHASGYYGEVTGKLFLSTPATFGASHEFQASKFVWAAEQRDSNESLTETQTGYRMQTNLHIAVETNEQAMKVVDAALTSG